MDDLEQIMWVHHCVISYLEDAYRKDINKYGDTNTPVGWRTLNAIQKGTNRRLVKNKREKASLDTLRAALQIFQYEATVEQETVNYPLRPDSNTFFRLTSNHWLLEANKKYGTMTY